MSLKSTIKKIVKKMRELFDRDMELPFKTIAYFYSFEFVGPCEISITKEKLKSLDSLSLICVEDKVKVSDEEYCDISNEGIYRIISPKGFTRQFIKYKKSLNTLLHSIALLFVHASGKDNFLETEELIERCRFRVLETTCGTTARVAKHILEIVGISCRVVSVFTMDDWNTYDNGHTLLEFWDQKFKKWALIDFDLKCRFLGSHKQQPIGLMELTQGVDFEMEFFAPRQLLGQRNSNSDSTFLMQRIFLSNDQAFHWIKEKAQHPVLHTEGGLFGLVAGSNELNIAKQHLPQYQFCTEEQFQKLYYTEK
jgi:hypothetical protein